MKPCQECGEIFRTEAAFAIHMEGHRQARAEMAEAVEGPLTAEMGDVAAGRPIVQALAYVYAAAYDTSAARYTAELARQHAACAALDFRKMLRECGELQAADEQ